MVVRQILDLYVEVRALVGQQKTPGDRQGFCFWGERGRRFAGEKLPLSCID